jgi:hypothetical protein
MFSFAERGMYFVMTLFISVRIYVLLFSLVVECINVISYVSNIVSFVLKHPSLTLETAESVVDHELNALGSIHGRRRDIFPDTTR